MINLGRIHRQIKRCENRTDKKPVAQVAADQIGMFALPAQPSGLPKRLFWYGRSIDKDFHLAATLAIARVASLLAQVVRGVPFRPLLSSGQRICQTVSSG